MNSKNPTPPQDVRPSRRDRLHALLFAGAALGTTLLMFGAAGPKLPPYTGE
jgi:hypothetical protein